MTCFMSPTSPADAAPSAAANYEPGGCQGKSASVPGSFPARQKFEGLLTWGSLQTFSFGAWCSTLCAQVLKSRTPFSEFVKTTLHVARGSTTASELAIFPLPVPKECQISFWWGLQNGPPQVMSQGPKTWVFLCLSKTSWGPCVWAKPTGNLLQRRVCFRPSVVGLEKGGKEKF